MSFTATQIIALRAPQWHTDPRIPDMIVLAKANYSQIIFGDRWEEIAGLHVLHWLTLDTRNGGNPGIGTNSGSGTTGAIVGESEGDLSRQYANPSSNNNNKLVNRNPDLLSTQYGLEILAIINKTVFSPLNRMI
jgi:hypothetical protein